MGAGRGRDQGRPLGVVLAGGRGSRLGGAKATVRLAGRPLLAYPLAALAVAGLERLVVAKPGSDLERLLVARPGSELPATEGVRTAGGGERPGGRGGLDGSDSGAEEARLLIEPPEPRHPLCGTIAALRAAPGRAAVVVPCDMPFLTPALLGLLATAAEPLVVLSHRGQLQPLPGRYAPALLPELEAALRRGEPLRRTAAALGARVLDEIDLGRCGDLERLLFNVNDEDDLRRAESLLTSGGGDAPALDRHDAIRKL